MIMIYNLCLRKSNLRNMNITTESTETIIKQLNLIKGEFLPADAHDILEHLISKKINYHMARNFSSQIRFGKEDQNSVIRIKELKKTMALIDEIIEEAKLQGKTLSIQSDISIKLI